MGLVNAKIRLMNPANPEMQGIDVNALVDTGAPHLRIPEHIRLRLGLRELEKREVILADGRRQLCPYVGPVEIEFHARRCFVGALVLGDSVLLGAIPMEDMDLVVHLAKRKLSVNPESPNIPTTLVK